MIYETEHICDGVKRIFMIEEKKQQVLKALEILKLRTLLTDATYKESVHSSVGMMLSCRGIVFTS